MRLDTEHPANVNVLRALARRTPGTPPVAPPDGAGVDPYLYCGSHPDVVARVWDELGKVVAADARCLVHGTPALVIPTGGVVVAVCWGTQYCIRVPADSLPEVLAAGASPVNRWSDGSETDLRQDLGPDWVFGSFLVREQIWCELVALEYQPPPPPTGA